MQDFNLYHKMKHQEVCYERSKNMPTINQIVRKGRGSKTKKSKSPVLNVRLNSLTKRTRELPSPQHSSIHAWKIPWTEEPGRLQSMGSQRVGHN